MNHREGRREQERVRGKAWSRKSRAGLTARFAEEEVAALPIRNPNIGTIKSAQRIFLLGVMVVFLVGMVSAQVPDNFPDVTAISLEDLMNLNVTSVSKRTQKLADAAVVLALKLLEHQTREELVLGKLFGCELMEIRGKASLGRGKRFGHHLPW